MDSPESTDKPSAFVRYLNTVLLSIIITIGGAFSAFMGSRSISQGETLAEIRASQVTRAEIETKLNAMQLEASTRWAAIQNEQIALRAKLAELEIKVTANAALLKGK